MMESDGIDDNVLAVLARLGNAAEAVREIVYRIAKLEEREQGAKLEQLSVLAGLRRLGHLVEEERHRMPVTESLLNHDLFGPVFKQGLDQGHEVGRQEGRREEVLEILRRLIQKRFGPIPQSLYERLARFSTVDLEAFCERVFDARGLEDLLK